MQEEPNQNPPENIQTPVQQTPISQVSPHDLEAEQTPSPVDTSVESNNLSWTASEYILHEKTKNWYVVLILVTIVAAAMFFLITKDISVVCLVLVCGFVFGFYGSRKPRQIEYEISEHHLTIDSKKYQYREFKSFSVASEGAFSSIVLWPHKRFAQLTSIYYPPEYEERISKAIGAHLPLEEHNPDFVERLTSHLRF